MPTEHSFFLGKYKFYTLLVAIGFLVYFNGFFGTFVWDDLNQIKDNYLIHSLGNIPQFFFGSTFLTIFSMQNLSISA